MSEGAGRQVETAVVGGGCFWCLEAVYQRLPGIVEVTSGYAGGHIENPTYRQVCGKETGHAEVVRVRLDPSVTSYANVLEAFWLMHDPTTRDRQGHDVGPQYRSVILYDGETQHALAKESRDRAQAGFRDPIVTEIAPLGRFWPAEPEHHDYYNRNSFAPYCAFNITPKLKKLGL